MPQPTAHTTPLVGAEAHSLAFYPTPFAVSPGLSTLRTPWYADYGHLTFWFFFLATFVVVAWLTYTFVALSANVEQRRPVRETRGFSRAQTGDTMTAMLPLTWSVTMLAHASTHSTNFDENTTAAVFSFTVIAYQWGWNYYFPREVVDLLVGAARQVGHGRVTGGAGQDPYAGLLSRARLEYLTRLGDEARYTAPHGCAVAGQLLLLATVGPVAPAEAAALRWALAAAPAHGTATTSGAGEAALLRLRGVRFAGLHPAHADAATSRVRAHLGSLEVLPGVEHSTALRPTSTAAFVGNRLGGVRTLCGWVGHRCAAVPAPDTAPTPVTTPLTTQTPAVVQTPAVEPGNATPNLWLRPWELAKDLERPAIPLNRWLALAHHVGTWLYRATYLLWLIDPVQEHLRAPQVPYSGASTPAAQPTDGLTGHAGAAELDTTLGLCLLETRATDEVGLLGALGRYSVGAGYRASPLVQPKPGQAVGVRHAAPRILPLGAGSSNGPAVFAWPWVEVAASGVGPKQVSGSGRVAVACLGGVLPALDAVGGVAGQGGVFAVVAAPVVGASSRVGAQPTLTHSTLATPRAHAAAAPGPVGRLAGWLEGVGEAQVTRTGGQAWADPVCFVAKAQAPQGVAYWARPLQLWAWRWALGLGTAALAWDRTDRAAFAHRPYTAGGFAQAEYLEAARLRFDKLARGGLLPEVARASARRLGWPLSALDTAHGAVVGPSPVVLPAAYLDVDPVFSGLRWAAEVNTTRRSDHDARYRVVCGPALGLAESGTPTTPRGGFTAAEGGVGSIRRLRVTKGVYLPADVPMHGIFGSKDVIHSWAIPGLGVKIDCIPGYSSHRRLLLRWRGLYWGQCMEVCGRYHHWMPLLVRVVHRDVFLVWCLAYLRLLRATSVGGSATVALPVATSAWVAAVAARVGGV